jgi:hypothetical protein
MSQQTVNCIESKIYAVAQSLGERLKRQKKLTETAQAEAAVAFGLLYRAMSVIEDLTTLRPPAVRLQVEIEKLNEELIEINGADE